MRKSPSGKILSEALRQVKFQQEAGGILQFVMLFSVRLQLQKTVAPAVKSR
jgi:hypothetical protein